MGLPTTHDELWCDYEFIARRLFEQVEYWNMYKQKEFYSEERRKEVIESTEIYMTNFYYRLAELAKQDEDARFMFNAIQIAMHSIYGKQGTSLFDSLGKARRDSKEGS